MYRPAKNSLLDPLTVIFRDRNPERASERTLATNLLADYAADNPAKLADLIMDADDKQFAVIYPKLKERRAQGLPLLTGEIDRKLPADMPSSDEKREKLAKRQANAAVALLKMGQAEKVWPLLKRSKEPDDPRVRSYLIHGFGPLGAEAGAIIKRLDDEPDITIRRALILSLGEFKEKELPPDVEKALLEKLKAMYRRDADPGLHAASEWLLRRWKEETWLKQENEEWAKDKEQTEKRLDGIKQLITKEKERTPPQWYVNGQGQTMVVIPGPVEFLMGSPPTEAGRELRENQHKRRIGRTFALAAKSVTLAEYQRFDPGYGGETQQWSPTGDCPVLGISWFQAAAYCNWLSKQEGLPESEWCYEPLREAKAVPVLGYKVGMKLAANYLKRSGYRLPTEAEMEFATRAGSVTSRYYGETEELLPKYAWYNKNGRDRSWPVGSKKPNDFGLFDVQGNVFTWCQESFKPYPKSKENETTEDEDDALSVNLDNRGLRGGSFGVQASVVRSAFRQGVVPTYRSDGDVGVRPARTSPP
jgi:eukaryotic-like serine/threonine-protein kinase